MQTRLHRCRKQTGSVEAMFCCSIGEIQLSLFRVRQGGARIFYIANDAESIRCNISWTFAIEQPHDEGLGSEMAFQGVSMAILFGASALRAQDDQNSVDRNALEHQLWILATRSSSTQHHAFTSLYECLNGRTEYFVNISGAICQQFHACFNLTTRRRLSGENSSSKIVFPETPTPGIYWSA